MHQAVVCEPSLAAVAAEVEGGEVRQQDQSLQARAKKPRVVSVTDLVQVQGGELHQFAGVHHVEHLGVGAQVEGGELLEPVEMCQAGARDPATLEIERHELLELTKNSTVKPDAVSVAKKVYDEEMQRLEKDYTDIQNAKEQAKMLAARSPEAEEGGLLDDRPLGTAAHAAPFPASKFKTRESGTTTIAGRVTRGSFNQAPGSRA